MSRRTHPVKVALAQRGEFQSDCARAIGVAPSLLTQVLNGHQAPWPALRRKLAEHLGCSESELFPDFETGEGA